MIAYLTNVVTTPEFWLGVGAALSFFGLVGGLTGVVILVWLYIAVRS